MTCPAPIHGTVYAYQKRCRCPEAKQAHAAQQRRWRKRAYLQGRVRTDATGTRRRIQALYVMGWSASDLASRLGYDAKSSVWWLTKRAEVYRSTAERIARLYDELSMTRGPSRHATRYALEHGWPPPLAWDDDTIDDPEARPQGAAEGDGIVDEVAIERALAGEWIRLTRAEKAEAARLGVGRLGWSETARVLRLSGGSLSALLGRSQGAA